MPNRYPFLPVDGCDCGDCEDARAQGFDPENPQGYRAPQPIPTPSLPRTPAGLALEAKLRGMSPSEVRDNVKRTAFACVLTSAVATQRGDDGIGNILLDCAETLLSASMAIEKLQKENDQLAEVADYFASAPERAPGEFRPGDVVRCVDAEGSPMRTGGVYTVEDVEHDHGAVYLSFAAPIGGGWGASRFVLA